MSQSVDLFDLAKAREARDWGIHLVAQSKEEWLEEVREQALWAIDQWGEVDIDHLRKMFVTHQGFHHNIWGAVFKDKRFKWTGRYVTSSNVSNHARVIRVWERA